MVGKKVFFNLIYMVIKPRATLLVFTRHRLENLPDAKGRSVVVIRPKDDVLMHKDTPSLLAGRGYELVEIPGSHDDCWAEPLPYVNLMREKSEKAIR